MTIETLIDKQDVVETLGLKILEILVTNVEAQKVLAVAAGKDPALWDLRVYHERTNPWEDWLNGEAETTNKTPMVNVWLDNTDYDDAGSNVMERNWTTGLWHIDVYTYAVAADDGATGHEPADLKAALELQRAVRLVRNILMAAKYTYLDLPRGTVGRRRTDSIQYYQPQSNDQPVQRVQAARMRFEVDFNEFSPQVPEEVLEYLSVAMRYEDGGAVILQVDYQTPFDTA